MVSFYKHDIAAWRGGTVTLSDRAYRVYHVIVEEIMLAEGPIALHERSLAGKSNRSTRDLRAALSELETVGKITIRDGFIDNSRAERELNNIRTNREHAAKGGRKVREVDKNHNNINGYPEAPLVVTMEPKRERIREEKKDTSSLRSDVCPKRVRTAYSPEFEELWKAYPTDANMVKSAAYEAWKRLHPDDQRDAMRAVPAYRAYCQAHPDYRPKHLDGWLKKGQWQGHLQAQLQVQSRVFVRDGTTQWNEWRTFLEGQGQKIRTPVFQKEHNAMGWYFPSEFPVQRQRDAAE